jgi:hypothetical protein
MTELPTSRPDGEDNWYWIRIQGRLDPRWESWFDGMQLSCDRDGTTLLHGRVPDQAALHGLLMKIRDMGLPLVSVVRGPPAAPPQPETSPGTLHPRQESS